MSYAEAAALAVKLLTPEPFKREHWKEFLSSSYSRKLQQRVPIRTPAGYELWVHLESDVGVARYNMLVQEVAVPTTDGDAIHASPAAISVASKTGAITIHTFAEFAPVTDQSLAPTMRSKGGVDWDSWADKRGWVHTLWTSAKLTAKPMRQENLKQLLRHVCVPGNKPRPALCDRLMAEMRQVRTLTVHALRAKFPGEDQCEFMTAVAALILDGEVFSDIDGCPFETITRLSAHQHGLSDQ